MDLRQDDVCMLYQDSELMLVRFMNYSCVACALCQSIVVHLLACYVDSSSPFKQKLIAVSLSPMMQALCLFNPAFSDLTKAPILASMSGGPNQTTYMLSRGH